MDFIESIEALDIDIIFVPHAMVGSTGFAVDILLVANDHVAFDVMTTFDATFFTDVFMNFIQKLKGHLLNPP